MSKNKILQKVLAVILIFTLTFANFAFTTKSYASSLAEAIFGTTSDTGTESVSFDAYFETESGNSGSVISDVNNKNLFISIGVDVKDKGYLKDAKITIAEAEEGKGINFDIREDIKEDSEVVREQTEIVSSEQDSVVPIEASKDTSENEEVQEEVAKEIEKDKSQAVTEDSKEIEEQILEEDSINEEKQNSEKDSQEIEKEKNQEVTENSEETQENSENSENIENDFKASSENLNEVSGIEENSETEEAEVEEDTQKVEEKQDLDSNQVAEENQVQEVEEKTIKEVIESEEHIESFENNTFYLNQVNGTSEIRIQVPIEYKNEEFVNENQISSDSKVIFTGVYVDNDGNEVKVSKEVTLRVSWKDDRNIDAQSEATKYINYGEGIILQTVERIDNKAEEKTLPVKKTELEIDVPKLKDKAPNKITVVANTTEGTNGEGAGEVEFSEENWTYNIDENKLLIKVNNDKQLVDVNENEEDYLQDAEKEVVQEERYYNGSGIDEFLVTYTYSEVEVAEEEAVTVGTNVTAKMTTVSGSEGENTSIDSKDYIYELKGQAGDIVSLNKNNKKEEISKAYTYVNYNNNGRYETEIPEEMIINISYKDIVNGIEVKDEKNVYVDKEGNTIPNNDIYYKRISIAKTNFDKILGETGEIKVEDENENVISIINKDSSVNESGNIEIGFGERYSKLSFEVSKPAGEGNLIISTVKALSNAEVDKQTYANLDRIQTRTSIKANYSYVEGQVEVGQVETGTRLTDTNTDANLVIDRGSLSTLEENKDVEMRIELNNARESSDIFGHSEFEIELPENVEKIDVTNISLLYGEGLQITSNEVNGKIIRIVLDGAQEGINSGVLTNGTNIVINANIKVNLYAPAKTEIIKFRYNNSEITNGTDGGYKELPINYSAPTGLVAVNTISNYNDEGSVITSVRQGKKEGFIGIYAPARDVTTEIIVMNNHSNNISNMNILGRTAFVGVKDLKTGEELGTTIDSKMVIGIEPDARNRGTFKVYYSENGEATNSLENPENGWIEAPASLGTIKSYLIVPQEPNYTMEASEVLRFTYTHSIPENLAHNEYFYGTFGVYYRNNSEVAKTNEMEKADLVGLTTGVGPELKITVTPSKEQVKEYEEFYLDVVIENIGEVRAENVVLDVLTGDKATYSRYECDRDDVTVTDSMEEYDIYTEQGIEKGEKVVGKKIIVPNLDTNSKLSVKVFLTAKELGSNVYYDKEEEYIKGESDTIGELVTEKKERDDIKLTSKVTAKDLKAELTNESNIEVISAEISIKEKLTTPKKIEKAGNILRFTLEVKNQNSTKNMNNIVIKKILPKELNFKNSDGNYTYDENTRELKWTIGTLETKKSLIIQFELGINEIEENINKTTVKTISTAKADGTEEYSSSEIAIDIAKPVLVIKQTSDNVNTYIKEGEKLNYTFSVKNEGEVSATFVNLSNVVPDGIEITNIRYTINGIETNRSGIMKDDIKITTNIEPGAELIVNLEAIASSLNGAEEKTVTNYATVNSKEVNEIKSNDITHIVEATEKDSNETEPSYTLGQGENITKTYRISGLAWFDGNQNGMRETNEELLKGIIVKLVDSNSGMIQKTATTDDRGEYTFAGINNGSYLVIFEYDSSKYIVTTYQKDGVVSNVNSDAILTTITQGGNSKEGAVTDTIKIEGGSVSNIDIGLMSVDRFDLQLDKSISKVMIQTIKETTTEEYENAKVAKAEIAAKYMSSSTVYVEYTITVSNVGDIAGYAKKIVDYIPEGMTFNSSLEANSDWYTGSDGNLYSETLANKELQPGEKASLKLVLTKQMSDQNTGLVNNQAEIYEDYNTYGVEDMNSKPGNKSQNENDLSYADIIISVKTGEVFIYISIIITTILLGSIIVFITYNKVVVSKRKWVI